MALSIRAFAPGDEQAFRELNEAWITRYFEMEAPDVAILNDPKGLILDPVGHVLIAELDGASVGTCALVAMPKDTFEVVKMAVAESQRGKGIGRELMAAVVETARRVGAKRLHLETNSVLEPAIRLYESFGFVRVAANSEFRRADVAMEL
ncbi:MAG: GNAT family N-acetyltransferase, partial [Acidobacteriota bacterium]